jgi:uncharacterized BrkB/YihY/UPF0761 family membrane protein
MNLNSFTKNSRTIVAIAVIFFGFTLLFAMLFWEFPPEQKDIYYSVSGVVGTLLSLVVSYYFGASKTETQHESDTKKSDKDLTDD